jgi:hypothetical protein
LEDDDALPLGWEIFMTEAFLVQHIDPSNELHHCLIEDVCLDLLVDQADPRLGSQLPFAVYDAIARGAFPETLRPLFHRWKTPSKSLMGDLADFWAARDEALPKLAQMCLEAPLSPPLAPPTVDALSRLGLPNPGAHG